MRKVMGYRLWVIGSIIFLSFLLTACAAQPDYQPSENVAEQKADPYAWDFGNVKEGAVLKHDFIFKNESKSVLTIKGTATSCGCTVSEVKKKTLLSQESTLLTVQFKTKGYSGPVKQYIFVTTDSLDNPVVRFIIKAQVVKGGI